MKELSNVLFEKFFNLLMSLEPENIWMDGEASEAEAKKQETAILIQWSDLESILGRTVSQAEIWDRYASSVHTDPYLEERRNRVTGEEKRLREAADNLRRNQRAAPYGLPVDAGGPCVCATAESHDGRCLGPYCYCH